MRHITARLRRAQVEPRVAAALLVLITALTGITIAVVDTDGPGGPDRPRVVITVPLRDGAGDVVTVTTPASALQELADSAGELGAGEGLRTAKPDGAPAADIKAADRQADAIAAGPDALPVGAGLGATENLPAGCKARYVQNQSDRGQTAPETINVHYPVAKNIAGLVDMNALAGWLNNPRSQVSYHRVFDWDGNCMANVPLARKAWAVAAYNRISINYSMMGRGAVDGKFAPAAALRAMAADIARTAKAYRIPIRRGLVSGGRVVRSGILAHSDLGAAGGGHVDIKPWSIDDVIAEVQRQSVAQSVGASQAAERRAEDRALTCRRMVYHRKKAHPWTGRRVARVKALKAHAAAVGLDERRCRA